MNWDRARQLLRRRAGDADVETAPRRGASLVSEPPVGKRALSLSVVSGKGGTGKTLVSASLASIFARESLTLVIDADFGLANAHILHDLTPDQTLVDVVEGRCSVRDVVAQASSHLHLLGGGSGFSRMAGLSTVELHLIAAGISDLEPEYDRILVDSAAGLSNQTVSFATASDVVLLVTTPDVTAMTDAYAFLKVFTRRKPDAEPLIVVNRARDEDEARHAAERIIDVSRRFLGRSPRWIGTLPEDRAAFRSSQRRRSVVRSEPDSPLGQALLELGKVLGAELDRTTPKGLGQSLMRSVAYSPKTI